VRIALDVSEAMRFLHDSDLYHRDLKSVYVLIDTDSRAKLTGFGGVDDAKGWSDASAKGKMMKGQQVATSISHQSKKMSVESEDEKLIRKQADIAAFGIILWELITGHVPKLKKASPSKGKKNTTSSSTSSNPVLYDLAVAEKDLKSHPAALIKLMQQCNVTQSKAVGSIYDFSEVFRVLHEVLEEENKKIKDRSKLVPDGFLCPITQDVMKDPVMLIDGHSYERKAIVDWLKRSNRSPLTNEELPMMSKDATMPLMVDNYALKSAICNYLESKIG
jgi:serine/threonine protein kinase